MAFGIEGYIELPEHAAPGGFDHAAVLDSHHRLYLAHTANNAVDIVDLSSQSYAASVEQLSGVAGALVDEASGLVFTSNRGEDTVGIFAADFPASLTKVKVGVRPNGLAYDARRGTLLAANVGDPARPETHTVSIVDVARRTMTSSVAVAGRTRWTVYDPVADAFFVNIADPPTVVVISADDPTHIARVIEVPSIGPHGLDTDAEGRLFCACDAGRLLVLEPPAYDVSADIELVGGPDVIFLDRALGMLFVAIGDPGVVQVIDVVGRRSEQVIETERGAHTMALDQRSHAIYAFLPDTHRAAVLRTP